MSDIVTYVTAMRCNVDTDPLLVLHAKPYLVKNKVSNPAASSSSSAKKAQKLTNFKQVTFLPNPILSGRPSSHLHDRTVHREKHKSATEFRSKSLGDLSLTPFQRRQPTLKVDFSCNTKLPRTLPKIGVEHTAARLGSPLSHHFTLAHN